MPKAKPKSEPKEATQPERFKKAARDLEAAGELDLTEAGKKFERAFDAIVVRRKQKDR